MIEFEQHDLWINYGIKWVNVIHDACFIHTHGMKYNAAQSARDKFQHNRIEHFLQTFYLFQCRFLVFCDWCMQ